MAFAPSVQHRRAGLAPGLTVALIGLILLVEFSLISWLPRQLSKHNFWPGELVRQETFKRLDELRNRINQWPEIAVDDPDTRPALDQMKAEADKLAFYLRKDGNELPAPELRVLQRKLENFHRQLDKLAAKSPPPRHPNLDPPIRGSLKQEEPR